MIFDASCDLCASTFFYLGISPHASFSPINVKHGKYHKIFCNVLQLENIVPIKWGQKGTLNPSPNTLWYVRVCECVIGKFQSHQGIGISFVCASQYFDISLAPLRFLFITLAQNVMENGEVERK